MGASESSLSTSLPQNRGDEITTVSKRTVTADPILEKLKSLNITSPILTSPPPTETSLTDILVRRSASSAPCVVDPKVILELFSVYRDWQEKKIQQISKRQEDLENRIEVADALAVKLHQRFSYSVSAMKTTSQHLSEVHSLKVELGELKGRLTEVISNCDALCKRIGSEGPHSLQASIKPFVPPDIKPEGSSSLSTEVQDSKHNSSPAEADLD